MARLNPQINAGSMADIAFLLLIFFLVTASMNVETGIRRKLPPLPEKEQENVQVKKRNVFEVLVNSSDMLLVNGATGDITTLRKQAREFLTNPASSPDMPEKELLSARETRERAAGNLQEAENIRQAISVIGDVYVSKGIISLQSDRGTSYKMYIAVQNELAAAVREMRDELSMSKFGIPFSKLTNKARINAIQKAVPMSVSEAEPFNVSANP